MYESTLSALLAASFVLGLLHAFDADHIVAVSSLAGRRRDWRSGMVYALKWALGHGGILLLVAVAALYFRWRLPEFITHSAERIVGVILIVAGLSILWRLYRQRVTLRPHRHGDIVHAHLATAEQPVSHDHKPVLVGIVHGLAGSAPALALIPATFYQPLLGIGYMLIFSAGVLAGMLSFGVLLSHGQRFVHARGEWLLNGWHGLLGVGATVLGVVWLSAG
jgi:sulfite exporter TauE/SafE